MAIVSLKDARALSLKRYFTGVPCSRGHVCERNTSGRSCVECVAEKYQASAAIVIARSAAWRDANRDRVNELAVQRRAKDPEAAREKERLIRPKYAANKSRQVKEWKAKNADRHKENQARWFSENLPKRAAYSSKRRAVMREVENTLTGDDVIEVTRLQGGRCAYCAVKKKLTVDHIHPISKGGGNVRQNIQMLCKNCNSQKHATHPIEFARKIGLLL